MKEYLDNKKTAVHKYIHMSQMFSYSIQAPPSKDFLDFTFLRIDDTQEMFCRDLKELIIKLRNIYKMFFRNKHFVPLKLFVFTCAGLTRSESGVQGATK